MVTVTARPGAVLPLGREGENLARQIVFDIARWQTEYGPGTVSLIAQRPGDPAPYPCAITVDGSTVTWPITSADTAAATKTPGVYAYCELQYRVDDVLVKSETWRTFVADALGEPSPEPPEPWQGWVDQVLSAVAGAGGGDILRINTDDYGLNWSSSAAQSVPDNFVSMITDSYERKRALYITTSSLGVEASMMLTYCFQGNSATVFGGIASTDTAAFMAMISLDTDAQNVKLQIAPLGGETGTDGATFYPDVSDDGMLSWSNDRGLPNPDPVNIMGPEGPAGPPGENGVNGNDGAPGKDNLPNVETLAGAAQSLELTHNVEYRCVDALTSLTVTGFGAPPAGKAALYSIQFTAGEGIAVTVPETVIWAVAEPVWTADSTYWITWTELGDKYLAVWVEVPADE